MPIPSNCLFAGTKDPLGPWHLHCLAPNARDLGASCAWHVSRLWQFGPPHAVCRPFGWKAFLSGMGWRHKGTARHAKPRFCKSTRCTSKLAMSLKLPEECAWALKPSLSASTQGLGKGLGTFIHGGTLLILGSHPVGWKSPGHHMSTELSTMTFLKSAEPPLGTKPDGQDG